MSITPELTQDPEGLLVLSEAKATELSEVLATHATSAHDFGVAIDLLTQTNHLAPHNNLEYAVHLNTSELAALLNTPSADIELLDELYDNPPIILKDMLGALATLRAQQGTKEKRTSPQERTLVTSITVISNLFLILHTNNTTTQARGIWAR